MDAGAKPILIEGDTPSRENTWQEMEDQLAQLYKSGDLMKRPKATPVYFLKAGEGWLEIRHSNWDWHPWRVDIWLDGYSTSGNDSMARVLFFSDNPHLWPISMARRQRHKIFEPLLALAHEENERMQRFDRRAWMSGAESVEEPDIAICPFQGGSDAAAAWTTGLVSKICGSRFDVSALLHCYSQIPDDAPLAHFDGVEIADWRRSDMPLGWDRGTLERCLDGLLLLGSEWHAMRADRVLWAVYARRADHKRQLQAGGFPISYPLARRWRYER
jgi:hypothetical protein